MKIREQQIAAFESSAAQQFFQRVAVFLQEEFPEAADMDTQDLFPDIEKQFNNAKSYGLISEQQIIIYIVTSWAIDFNFDEKYTEAYDILKMDSITASEKADQLQEWTIRVSSELQGDQQ